MITLFIEEGGLLINTKAILWDVVCRRRRPLLSSLCAQPQQSARFDGILNSYSTNWAW
jgi:hypothetical protein